MCSDDMFLPRKPCPSRSDHKVDSHRCRLSVQSAGSCLHMQANGGTDPNTIKFTHQLTHSLNHHTHPPHLYRGLSVLYPATLLSSQAPFPTPTSQKRWPWRWKGCCSRPPRLAVGPVPYSPPTGPARLFWGCAKQGGWVRGNGGRGQGVH
jgi:hypothetical protein